MRPLTVHDQWSTHRTPHCQTQVKYTSTPQIVLPILYNYILRVRIRYLNYTKGCDSATLIQDSDVPRKILQHCQFTAMNCLPTVLTTCRHQHYTS
mgnify:CR=1 FL=1